MGIESLLRLGLRTPVPAGITYLRGGPGIAGLASALTPAHRAGLLRPSALAFRAAPPESKARRAVIGSAGEVVTITGPEVVCLPNAPDSAQRAQASRWAVSARKAHHGALRFRRRELGRGPTRSCSLRHRMAPIPSRGASVDEAALCTSRTPRRRACSEQRARSRCPRGPPPPRMRARTSAKARDRRRRAGRWRRIRRGRRHRRSVARPRLVSGADAPRATALDALTPVLATVEDEDGAVRRSTPTYGQGRQRPRDRLAGRARGF